MRRDDRGGRNGGKEGPDRLIFGSQRLSRGNHEGGLHARREAGSCHNEHGGQSGRNNRCGAWIFGA